MKLQLITALFKNNEGMSLGPPFALCSKVNIHDGKVVSQFGPRTAAVGGNRLED